MGWERRRRRKVRDSQGLALIKINAAFSRMTSSHYYGTVHDYFTAMRSVAVVSLDNTARIDGHPPLTFIPTFPSIGEHLWSKVREIIAVPRKAFSSRRFLFLSIFFFFFSTGQRWNERTRREKFTKTRGKIYFASTAIERFSLIYEYALCLIYWIYICRWRVTKTIVEYHLNINHEFARLALEGCECRFRGNYRLIFIKKFQLINASSARLVDISGDIIYRVINNTYKVLKLVFEFAQFHWLPCHRDINERLF